MSRPHLQIALAITEQTQVGQARRAAGVFAREQGLDETRAGRLALVVTEAAGNIVKHGGSGEILLRTLDDCGPHGVEVLALDQGPGMSDTRRCFEDGYSTAGSPGTGLGAISRLADVCDLHSLPGKGTALLARVHTAEPAAKAPFLIGAVCLPIRGESVPGDAWDCRIDNGRALIGVIDGLGHGALAAAAADTAVDCFRRQGDRAPQAILEFAHDALRSTRGATMAVAELRAEEELCHYAGIGNIGASILTGADSRSLVSHNGTVGLETRRIQAFSYPWSRRSTLIMYSDGLQSRWNLKDYPGLLSRHPALIAGVLYRDFSRRRDDVTVVVVRENLSS